MIEAIGNLIGAGLSLWGGQKAQKQQNEIAERNIQLQKDFAQQGIQWKVNDAKAAGIHPLYALGAQTHSFAPVSVGDSLSSAFANAGQYIGRAANATASGSQRINAVTEAAQSLALEKAGLENELLRSQIRRNNSAGTPPPMPHPGTNWAMPGQGATTIPDIPGTVVDKGLTRTGMDPSQPWSESGAISDVGFARNSWGGMSPIPSKDVKERIEDIMPAEWMWAVRNLLGPNIPGNAAMPNNNVPVPPGYDAWVWHPLRQDYVPMRFPKWMGRWGRHFAY